MVKAHSKWMVALVCFTLTWGTQPQAESSDSPSSDRRGGSNAASAMALAASAMQQVMCLKMMQEAQQKGDSTLMMMAMQMCAQAAASAANAAQNKDGGKKLTSTPPQTGSAAALKEMKLDTQAKDDDLDPGLFKPEDKTLTTSDSSKDEVAFESTKSDNGTGKVEQGKTSLADGTTPLSTQNPKELPSSQITLNEGGNGGSQGGSPWASQAAGLNTAQNTFQKGNESATALEEQKRKPLKKGSGSIDGSGSGAGGAEPADNSAFDDFVAKMMGGGAANSSYAAAGLGAGMLDITMDLQGNGAKPLTIFEFASLQYQKAKQTGLGTGVKRNLANSPSR